MSLFVEGKFFKEAGTGGGGGSDPHNLGYFADLTALQTAHPAGADGDFAILGSTDTIWVWDSGTSAWVDTDTKGQVTSVNNHTGDVTVQETLVSGTNIKTVDGNSLLGSGNLELSTYLTYPAGWTTTGTTKAFCDDIAADTSAVEGKAYLGEVTLSDLPASMANAEIVVEIMSGTTASNKVISLTCKSGNTAPYMWVYTYWDNGTNVSGWQGFATAAQGAKADTAVQPASLATVATSGLYSDLSGTPTIPAAIQVSTMPTAGATEEGKIYQFVGTTDANYTNGYFYKCVSDGQNPATYSWEAVEVQPAPSGLPDQTGQSGKFLTTDGTDASWSDKPLVNTGSNGGLVIKNEFDTHTISGNNITSINTNYFANTTKQHVAIGTSFSYNTYPGSSSVSIFNGCGTGEYSVGIGRGTASGAKSTAINAINGTASGENSIIIGPNTGATAVGAIQIGGASQARTNSDANTVKFGNANGNFEIMSADGTVPTDRLTKVNTTATLAVADWSSNTQTITVSGVKADSVVFVSPDPTSASDYASAGILCTAQAADSLTFSCTQTPTNAITVNVICM